MATGQYVRKLESYLAMVGSFLRTLRFSPPMKLSAMHDMVIGGLLKVALNTNPIQFTETAGWTSTRLLNVMKDWNKMKWTVYKYTNMNHGMGKHTYPSCYQCRLSPACVIATRVCSVLLLTLSPMGFWNGLIKLWMWVIPFIRKGLFHRRYEQNGKQYIQEPSHLDLCFLQISVTASLGINALSEHYRHSFSE